MNFANIVDKCNGKPPFSFTKNNDDVDGTKWSCCTEDEPCLLGRGDCDTDDQCDGSLICGSNNCKDEFSVPGTKWDPQADCCTGMYQYDKQKHFRVNLFQHLFSICSIIFLV